MESDIGYFNLDSGTNFPPPQPQTWNSWAVEKLKNNYRSIFFLVHGLFDVITDWLLTM